jgi:hypothetical protein
MRLRFGCLQDFSDSFKANFGESDTHTRVSKPSAQAQDPIHRSAWKESSEQSASKILRNIGPVRLGTSKGSSFLRPCLR